MTWSLWTTRCRGRYAIPRSLRERIVASIHTGNEETKTKSDDPMSTVSLRFSTSSASTSTKGTSVSSSEVSKFSLMASSWWDSTHNPLIGMNPVRVSFIVETLRSNGRIPRRCASDLVPRNKPLSGLRALDLGCGGGLLSESLSRLGASVTAIDPSEEVTAAAKEHSRHDPKTNEIDYRGGVSVEKLVREYGVDDCSTSVSLNDDLFDIICMLEVIEHATDQQRILDSATKLLKRPTHDGKPGGTLFVSTINRTAKSYALAILGAEQIMRVLPVGTHTWEKFVSPDEAEAMTRKLGLKTLHVCGMVLEPPFFNMTWTLDYKDMDINWIGAYSHTQ